MFDFVVVFFILYRLLFTMQVHGCEDSWGEINKHGIKLIALLLDKDTLSKYRMKNVVFFF